MHKCDYITWPRLKGPKITFSLSLFSQYAIYQTGFIRGSAGLPECVRNSPEEGGPSPIRPIESIGNNDQVKFLLSPGIELEPPQQ